MQSILLEHIQVKDLPESWRQKINASPETRVRVHIEEETSEATGANSLFGLWKDNAATQNVETYINQIREPRWKKDDTDAD